MDDVSDGWYVTFRCEKHKEDLTGEPIWFRHESETWWPDASNMDCPGWILDEEDECQGSWKIRPVGAGLRIKTLTPDENQFLGEALYGLCELNEGIEGDFVTTEEELEEEVTYNRELRHLVAREWPIDQER